jgi:hypothetical protein
MWAPNYASTSDLKAYLRVGDAVDDVQFALYVAAASRAVDLCCHRQFGAVSAPQARAYPVRYSRHRCRWVAEVDDLQTAAGITGVTGYTLEPKNAVSDGLAWTEMTFTTDPGDDEGMITPTASWGWSAFPDAVVLATLLQASRFTARRSSPFGVAGSPQQGSEVRLLERVDPDVKVSLRFYEREWWAR